MREARLQARFSHPAMLEVYRVWEQNATAYMAMRYYPGRSLRELRLDDTASALFEEGSIRQILSPVFDALEELHSQSVLHRDVSPDNILMLPTGTPVLLDFGSARSVVAGDEQSLTTVLKPGYAPLEQYADDGTMEQGPWTDVYGLGAVLHYLAIGSAPPQPVTRLLGGSMRAFDEGTAGRYSPQFVAAVMAALAVKPKDRLQSVGALRDALGWRFEGADQRAPTVLIAPAAAVAAAVNEITASTAAHVKPRTLPLHERAKSVERRQGPQRLVTGSIIVMLVALVAYFVTMRRIAPVATEPSVTTPTQSDKKLESPADAAQTQPSPTLPAPVTVEPNALPTPTPTTPTTTPPDPAPIAKNPEKRPTAKPPTAAAATSSQPSPQPKPRTVPAPAPVASSRPTSDTCERLFAKLSLGNATLTETEQKLLPGCR